MIINSKSFATVKQFQAVLDNLTDTVCRTPRRCFYLLLVIQLFLIYSHSLLTGYTLTPFVYLASCSCSYFLQLNTRRGNATE